MEADGHLLSHVSLFSPTVPRLALCETHKKMYLNWFQCLNNNFKNNLGFQLGFQLGFHDFKNGKISKIQALVSD